MTSGIFLLIRINIYVVVYLLRQFEDSSDVHEIDTEIDTVRCK